MRHRRRLILVIARRLFATTGYERENGGGDNELTHDERRFKRCAIESNHETTSRSFRSLSSSFRADSGRRRAVGGACRGGGEWAGEGGARRRRDRRVPQRRRQRSERSR